MENSESGYVLGINGGLRLGYQDVSAVLMKDGKVLAAIEEERLSRDKHAPGRLSEKSISEVLRIAGVEKSQLSAVATHGITWNDGFEEWLGAYLRTSFGITAPINRYHHHDCHAASGYYASGFNAALTVTIDGSGDGDAIRVYDCKQGKMSLLFRSPRPDSLGIFYSLITQYCGFERDSGEYKLMGLAPYGDPYRYDLSNVITTENGKISLNRSMLVPVAENQSQPTRQLPAYSNEFIRQFGKVPARKKGDKISQHYKDVAASAQHHLETVLTNFLSYWFQQTGHENLCLAGGVALNCAANKIISEMSEVKDLFVQPASSDSGVSLGAAYLYQIEKSIRPEPIKNIYLGTGFTEDELENHLKLMGVAYKKVDPTKMGAQLIDQGCVIGWFQGRSEFGPRALGNRSILASATLPDMKQRINSKIKFRESFRPFCPSVLEEEANKYFKFQGNRLPYMTVNVEVLRPEIVPSISHVNATARVQTVSKSDNPLFHQLLRELKKQTGHGICINTSFNRNAEPIVNHPRDAVATFFGSGLDALIIGPFLIQKDRKAD